MPVGSKFVQLWGLRELGQLQVALPTHSLVPDSRAALLQKHLDVYINGRCPATPRLSAQRAWPAHYRSKQLEDPFKLVASVAELQGNK